MKLIFTLLLILSSQLAHAYVNERQYKALTKTYTLNDLYLAQEAYLRARQEYGATPDQAKELATKAIQYTTEPECIELGRTWNGFELREARGGYIRAREAGRIPEKARVSGFIAAQGYVEEFKGVNETAQWVLNTHCDIIHLGATRAGRKKLTR